MALDSINPNAWTVSRFERIIWFGLKPACAMAWDLAVGRGVGLRVLDKFTFSV